MLDEHMQRGYLRGASAGVEHGWTTPERAGEIVQEAADQINHVPKYVRQAVKMLTKTLRDHDARSKVIDGTAQTAQTHAPELRKLGIN